ncbi:hypothetical protein SAMN05428949_2961 [Chitinophaga sp. YR627]|uniref:hypothetical protein n=1 Tax=Chitinophaga sp. YR627 TaxID=1881041 RepID=UPI0008EAF42E|nr:hypothetical protein [Chitinophaga sp. YR627]SFN47463.1 hypothetical protein SAMN05428949_2961 [Chitinophaga sp. YR627]
MKPYALLIALFFSGLGVSIAQERTRDKLFPHFNEDIAKMKQKENKLKTAPQPQNTRSTKEQLFTDYRPQNTKTRSSRVLNAKKTAGKNTSDVSAADAAKDIRSKQLKLPAPVEVPTQGNAQENLNAPAHSQTGIITPAPGNAAKPATKAPTTAPLNKSFQRARQ